MGHQQAAGVGAPRVAVNQRQLHLGAAHHANGVVNVHHQGRVETQLHLEAGVQVGETSTCDVHLVGLGAEQLGVAGEHSRALEHRGDVTSLAGVGGSHGDKSTTSVDREEGQGARKVVEVLSPVGTRAEAQSELGLGGNRRRVVHVVAEKAVGPAQRVTHWVEARALDDDVGLVVVDQLGVGGVQHAHTVLVHVGFHLSDHHSLVTVHLDRASSGVHTDHSQRTQSISPIVVMAQAQNDLILREGIRRNVFICHFFDQGGVEVKVHLLGADETSAVDSQLIGCTLVKHILRVVFDGGSRQNVGDNHIFVKQVVSASLKFHRAQNQRDRRNTAAQIHPLSVREELQYQPIPVFVNVDEIIFVHHQRGNSLRAKHQIVFVFVCIESRSSNAELWRLIVNYLHLLQNRHLSQEAGETAQRNEQ
mmetsp:Transcript_55183/g.96653  ORF Transcript_55183/g.96653 Transcript_55183/m.96653 type:complete len:420 (-) Transcript_55183:120-1379(-)